MAESITPPAEITGQPPAVDVEVFEPVDPRQAFRSALGRYSAAGLGAIIQARELVTDAARPSTMAAALTEQLESSGAVARQLEGLGVGSRLALSLFALTETTVSLAAGLIHALATLGVDARSALAPLLGRGLLAVEAEPEGPPIENPADLLEPTPAEAIRLRVHPAVPRQVRTVRPEGGLAATTDAVVQIRESDGLEPILRLAALWQRVGVEPLRQTQQGTLYKRDQERIEEDPALSDAVSDAPAAVPALPALWLHLARKLGVLQREPSTDRLEASPPGYWDENAVHLPQMIATSWLGLRGWRELAPGEGDPPDLGLPAACLRPAILLWLACLGEDQWVAIDDLAAHLRSRNPGWDAASFRPDPVAATGGGRRTRGRASGAEPKKRDLLSPMLLGAGFALGLVRSAEEKGTSRPVVQLTSLGRYVLGMGPPPPPRPSFEHFLFVQPNLEIIAYRQGLTPQLVGRLSRFAWWTKLGAALELKLTQESVHFGLDGGLTAAAMLELLGRHSPRPLPGLVPDAVGRWTERREQISFYASATLMEFGSTEERDQALAAWQVLEPGVFVPVAGRFLLVESADKVPTNRIRSGGSRDYRLPPERCISIEPDGVTLVLDPMRSDLLIDPELARISDELPAPDSALVGGRTAAPPPRRFLVAAASLRRAGAMGISAAQVLDWFERRTGAGASPAIRLLLRAASGATTTLDTRRLLVLTTPTEELADGLLQHPETRELLGERLGPTTVAVPEQNFDRLRPVLEGLGLRLPAV
ncbi:MAG: hypothetical protein U0790_05810 [Isosphaeraceae bacterium]